jgi:hypothetical protein
LREEHRLTVFWDRVLRKIFGLKMEEETADELHDLHFSPNIIWDIKSKECLDGICNTYGGEERCKQSLSGET